MEREGLCQNRVVRDNFRIVSKPETEIRMPANFRVARHSSRIGASANWCELVTGQQLHPLAQMMTATSKKIDRLLQSKSDISLMAPSSLLSTRQRDVARCLAENQRGQR